MKTYYIGFVIIFSIATTSVLGQQSGIYLSATDFEAGKLTYAINCKTEKHKIKLHEFLGKDYITVIHDKQPHDLKKKEIFGFKDCGGAIYRLGTDKHYQVMNPTEKILLYVIEFPGSKGQPKKDYYYFSASASGDIQELTLDNLKKAFPDNHKFHDALDAEFAAGSDLVLYDSFHKMYKVNRLYSNSLNK